MNSNDSTSRLTAFAEAIHAEETARSADVEAALETLTREAREQDGSVTRPDIERLVNEALEHDLQGEFAQHFLEVLQAERERDPFNRREAEAAPVSAVADQQEVDAVIDAERELEPPHDFDDYDPDGPDFDDGPSYG